MSEVKISEVIRGFFNNKPIFKNLSDEQDFFDIGASSLTVVDLQIQIEEVLNLEVATSKLMENPTLNGWISSYLDASERA
ncbi:acyl carrier protein [Microbulbifer sp. THAF38]|uniref:acyl carrier protein n=1 Tax=Microbulbifer sp. THAF38 TaxID=2587856 RepID=UPI001268E2A0|nr:acyl carrier protein [Microbulbifer sp. THAF38]QFT53929.1 Phosphopantetheine attachment site [Microbulbifer sp. THAF38]